MSQHDPQFPGYRARTSARWYRPWKTKRLLLPVPYIDRCGKFSIHRLGVWKTTPETLFFSTVSTISSRLQKIVENRWKGKRMPRSVRNLTVSVATVYAFSHNEYLFDRMLATLKPGMESICRSLVRCYSARLGDRFRFVHSQTKHNVSWLLYRSNWIRDNTHVDRLSSMIFLFRRDRRSKKFTFVDHNIFLRAANWLVLNKMEWTFGKRSALS